MLQDIYNNVYDDEDTFLGHHFVESDVNDESDFSDDEVDGVTEQEPIKNDEKKKDKDDGEDEDIVGDDNDNAQIELVVDDADDVNIDDLMSAELPKKQQLENLDEILNEDKFVDLRPQRKRIFKHADPKNTKNIDWEAIPSQQLLQPREVVNILRHKPGPSGTAKQAQVPLQSFNLFFTDEILEKVVTYTTNSIEPAMKRFSKFFKESDKSL